MMGSDLWSAFPLAGKLSAQPTDGGGQAKRPYPNIGKQECASSIAKDANRAGMLVTAIRRLCRHLPLKGEGSGSPKHPLENRVDVFGVIAQIKLLADLRFVEVLAHIRVT